MANAKQLQYQETFTWYSTSGVKQTSTQTLAFNASYSYDTEGKMTSVTYPSTIHYNQQGTQTTIPGPTYTYSFDAMDRPTGMTDQSNNTDVSNVTYNAANQLLSINYFKAVETRQYNSLNQMTSLTQNGATITYTFPSGTNNGKISQQTVSGETVMYQYDSLNRLLSAASNQNWSETYGYDAFGNLLTKTPTGSAPTLSQSVNAATNQIVGLTYDANGNQTSGPSGKLYYDVENRLTSTQGGAIQYAYDAQNKRIWSGVEANNSLTQTVYFYGVDGQRLGIYSLQVTTNESGAPLLWDTPASLSVYFGGRRVGTSVGAFVADRLGSNGSYYPYGEARGTVPQDEVGFATYTNDSATGLEYADQRYYASNFGRFLTPDRHRRSAKLRDPGSWNRYPYTRGDPINRNDPSGRCDVFIAGIIQNNVNSPAFQAAADADSADAVYAYSNQSNNSSLLKKLGNTLYGIAMVAAQAFGPNSSTYAAVVGLELAAGDNNPINVVTFSGGAAALTAAVNYLNSQGPAGQAVVGMIGNITYVAPGAVGSLYDNGQVSVIEGGGLANTAAGALTGVPGNAAVYNDTQHCGHKFACLANEFPDAFTQGDPCSTPAIVNQDRTIHYRYLLPNPFPSLNYFFDWLSGWAAGGPEDDGGDDDGDDDGDYQIMQ